MEIITRFAPSPTGSLHIGGIRTALFAYALTKKTGGKFILRIEDTDQKRFVAGATEEIIEMLTRYGVKPDIFPSKEELEIVNAQTQKYYGKDWLLHLDEIRSLNDEDFKDKYVQSLRIPLYQKYALKMIESGDAYISFEAKREYDKTKQKQVESSQIVKISLDEAIERSKNGEEFVVRLDVRKYAQDKNVSEIVQEDLLLGKKTYPIKEVSDQVLVKSNGIATYHLAVVVDDKLMDVNMPIRAFEWLPSTPKQKIIYEALGWEMPNFLHLTVILDPAGGKLSKRSGSVAAKSFIEEGYLPEAIINFLMFLGWSSPEHVEHGQKEREIYSLEEFINIFDIKDINKNNPVFNRKKLVWFNQQYLMMLSENDLQEKFLNWLSNDAKAEYTQNINFEELKEKVLTSDKGTLKELLVLEQKRSKTFAEMLTSINFFYNFKPDKNYSSLNQLSDVTQDQYNQIINQFLDVMPKLGEDASKWTHENWETSIRDIASKTGVKDGQAFMVLRYAMTASPISPPLFECMQLLGFNETKNRITLQIN